MAQAPINDNLNVTAPKAADDRLGVWQAGVFRAYLNFSEADMKLVGKKYLNMVAPFRTEVSSGVFQDVDYRWDGSNWVIFDANAAFTEASNKIPLLNINNPETSQPVAGAVTLANSSVAPLSQFIKSGNIYHNIGNNSTGEVYSVLQAANKFSGTPITDGDVDYNLYYKFSDGNYGIRHFPNNIIDITEIGGKASTLGLNSGFDNTAIIQKAIDRLYKRFKEGGGTVFFPKCSSTQSYKATTIKLPSYITLLGEGRSQIEALPSTETGLIKMADSPMREAHIDGIQLIPNVLNETQHGLDLTASTAFSTYNTGGAWYCTFRNIMAFGFGGAGINLVCQDISGQGDMANQFCVFENCKIEAKQMSSTSRAMFIKGQFGQTKFIQCQFDGAGRPVYASDGTLSLTDEALRGATSIEMISTPGSNGTDNIYSIDFDTCTIQRSDFGVTLDQAKGRFQNLHIEQVNKNIWAHDLARVTVDGMSEIGAASADGIYNYTIKCSGSYVTLLGNQLKAGYFVNDAALGFSVGENNFSQSQIRIGTKGFTKQISLSTAGVLSSIAANKNILLNLTSQDFITLSSQIITGNTLSITGFGGTSSYVRILTSDNLYIPSRFGTSLLLRNGDVAVFERIDLPSEGFKLINFISKERYGTTFPTTGTWFIGEKVINTAYVLSTDPIYWQCTVSSIVDSSTGVVTQAAEWKAIYDQDYGRPNNMSQRALTGTTLTFRNEDQLLNTNNGILDTITVPTAAYIRSGYRQGVRIWENGVAGSYIRLVNTGNIVLPNNQKDIILRGNDYVVFAYNNLAGIWALESISRSRNEASAFPVVGYWFVGETVYNNTNSPTVLGWRNLSEGYATRGQWSAGISIVAAEQRDYGGNVYRAGSTGTSGNIPLTHTSGSASDGNITWTYLGNSIYNIQTILNGVINNSSQGTYTISGTGQTTISIPHGLGATPSFAIVSPESADAINAGVISRVRNATNIVITLAVGANTGTNNLSYSWEARL